MTAKVYDRRKMIEYRENPAGKAVAALVLGILSIVFCALPIMLVGAVVGLMLERDSKRIGFHHLQSPAKVLCIVGCVLCSIVIIAIIAAVLAMGILAGR
ncbi:MAG: hypothetical protein HUJ76_03810 [Parasporobacterium sp.]|nr:hypothetical protein [Parasporobacterium sp.]